jgi:hypothetical protein
MITLIANATAAAKAGLAVIVPYSISRSVKFNADAGLKVTLRRINSNAARDTLIALN